MVLLKARGSNDMCGIASIILLSSQGNCIALDDFVKDCFLPAHIGIRIYHYYADHSLHLCAQRGCL